MRTRTRQIDALPEVGIREDAWRVPSRGRFGGSGIGITIRTLMPDPYVTDSSSPGRSPGSSE
jgi:hypothetical protein